MSNKRVQQCSSACSAGLTDGLMCCLVLSCVCHVSSHVCPKKHFLGLLVFHEQEFKPGLKKNVEFKQTEVSSYFFKAEAKNIFVKLRSRSRSGKGQVRVRIGLLT